MSRIGFLVETLQRLTDRHDIAVADIKTVVARVELRSSETQLVLNIDAIALGEHPPRWPTVRRRRRSMIGRSVEGR